MTAKIILSSTDAINLLNDKIVRCSSEIEKCQKLIDEREALPLLKKFIDFVKYPMLVQDAQFRIDLLRLDIVDHSKTIIFLLKHPDAQYYEEI